MKYKKIAELIHKVENSGLSEFQMADKECIIL